MARLDKHHSDSLFPSFRLSPLTIAIRGTLVGFFSLASNAISAELPIPKPDFVKFGKVDQSITGNKMIINQYTDRAVLNWKSFNISTDAAVQFKQLGSSSIALNRIYQNDPSRILGKLTANGQVYLVNSNGFVFGKEAKVDVNTLLASSLDITDETFQRGITKVIDQDGRPALTGNGDIYRRDEQGNFVLDKDGKKTKIAVQFEKGASVKTAQSGRIIAAAPQIRNEGDLSSPDGQILLIASNDKVYLQEARRDSELRGLLVEIGTGGEVSNLGTLLAEHGNITLMGFAVNQQGRVSATTSVQKNGSIRLLAREKGNTRREGDTWLLEPGKGSTERAVELDDNLGLQAKVLLGSGSLTEANPDLNDPTTAIDGQSQDVSRIDIMGKQVIVEQNATVRSLSGQVNITATANPADPGLDVKNDSRIYVDQHAVIDVSGVNRVSLPMERNVVTVELRSNELRDSPLQRKGILYAKKVKVDSRQGTPIADITGELERIERTVAERSTQGGQLHLVSEGDAILRSGALLNFSGGTVYYQPGTIQTTQLVRADGKTVDISMADPNQLYTHLFEKKGTFQEGYLEGKAGGLLSVKAAALALEAELQGIVASGVRQRAPDLQPAGSQLDVHLARTPDSTQAIVLKETSTPLAIEISAPFPRDPIDTTQPAPLILSGSRLRESRVARISLVTNGRILLDTDEKLDIPDGGKLTLEGGEIALDGHLVAHSGDVKLLTQLTGSTLGKLSGDIVLGKAAHMDLSGNWVNDRPADSERKSQQDENRILIDGGKLSIRAQGNVRLLKGSLVDVSGGARRTDRRDIQPGNAGTISLEAAAISGSTLSVEGSLDGYAVTGGKGGTLSLTSDWVVLGRYTFSEFSEADQSLRPLVLEPDFFARGGFEHYSIASNKSGLSVSDDEKITVAVENRVLNGSQAGKRSGSNLHEFSQVTLLPESLRPGGRLDLTLAQKVGQGTKEAAIRIGSGARLLADTGGGFSFTSDTSILMNGSVVAPSGQVSMTLTPPSGADPGFVPNQAIRLGNGAKIDVSGVAQLQNDKIGRTVGEVLPGGDIVLHADRGFVITEPGSLLRVSGTSAYIDAPSSVLDGVVTTEYRTIPSSGGKITIRAAEGIQLYGKLEGQSGADDLVPGATLSLELNPRTRNEPDQILPGQLPFPKKPSVISITQYPSSDGSLSENETVSEDQYGKALLGADQVKQGGFSSLSLRTLDRLELNGNIQLRTNRSLTFDAPVIAFQPTDDFAEGTAFLTSPYVAVGSTQTRPNMGTSLSGNGHMMVQAGLVDLVGTTALQGFATANLTSSGELRLIGIRTTSQQRDFLGEFLSPGNLTLSASQIYPATLSEFRVAVDNQSDGTLSVVQNGNPSSVLSAGGKLILEAPHLLQGGTIKAPLGTLVLKASQTLELSENSLTSNSGKNATVPFGQVQGGLDWIYPLGEQNLVLTAPPEKKLNLEAPDITLVPSSQIDTSGGGDIQAFEFVPGPGGSYDLLDPLSTAYQETYAILPDFKGMAAPYDPVSLQDTGLQVGDSVYLSGGSGLAAGKYVLLPAHYALLPGAVLVTPEPRVTVLPGQSLVRADGAPIVAGYRTVAGTSFQAPQWSGFTVEKGSVARLRAEYATYRANEFFSGKAKERQEPTPSLPRDGGAMAISAQTALQINGQVTATPDVGGRGGQLDIEATHLAIVNGTGQASEPDTVTLVADHLNALGVASIALGATRSTSGDTIQLRSRASSIRLEEGAELYGPEFILAAKENISLSPHSSINAIGIANGFAPKQTYQLDGDSAFMRVSIFDQVDYQRNQAQHRTGSIIVESAATVSSSRSILLDATKDVQLDGTLEARGGSIALGANRFHIGEVTESLDGSVLTNETLGALHLDELNEFILTSNTDINLFGAVDVMSKRLVLHSAGLLGFDRNGQTARLRSEGELYLDNFFGADSIEQGNGTGKLLLSAQSIHLGEGAYHLGGFSTASFEADKIVFEGEGTLSTLSDLYFQSALFTGGKGATTAIQAEGYTVNIEGNGRESPIITPSPGPRLSIIADSIHQTGQLHFPSGLVKLEALEKDLILENGAQIDVSGPQLELGNNSVSFPGGRIELISDKGNVRLRTGTQLDLSGAEGGILALSAIKGEYNFSGLIEAKGVDQGGQFFLDVGYVSDEGELGKMGTMLRHSGFDHVLSFHARKGDLHLGPEDSLTAHSLHIQADEGSITLEGQLKSERGEIELQAGDELRLTKTASITARGISQTDPSTATLASIDSDGDNKKGLVFEPGAKIDLTDLNGQSNGILHLRAPRQGEEIAIEGNLHNMVTGASETTVEAVRMYQKGGTIDPNDIAMWKADTDSYMSGAVAIETRLGLPGALRPGIEIQSKGDLTLGPTGWDLVNWRYEGRPGMLTLSANRDLTLNGSLSDAFKDDPNGIDLSNLLGQGRFMPVRDMLQTGFSWSYHLSAGNNITIGPGVTVRTGTGDIQANAGQDVMLTNASSALYTAGRPSETERWGTLKNAYVAYQFYGDYPIEGGDIHIQAGRDVIGARTGQLFDGWLARTGNWSRNELHTDEAPTAWAITIGGPVGTGIPQGSFQQNLGALGGGNIRVDAGRDLVDLSVVIPTTGKQIGKQSQPNDPSDPSFDSNQWIINGGGNLAISAGGDLIGGTFYTGHGTGTIHAGGSVIASPSANQFGPLFALGDATLTVRSNGDLTVGATIDPMVLNTPRVKNYFFSYSDSSSLDLRSFAGNIRFQNDIVNMIDGVNALRTANSQITFPGVSQEALTVYPPAVTVMAAQGDILLDRSFITYPGSTADFKLFSGGDITTGYVGGGVNITQSDANPSLLPSPLHPSTSWEDAAQRLQPFGDSNFIHAQIPVHQGDTDPVQLYAAGHIRSNDPLLFSFAKAVEVQAGKDLVDVSFQIQHPDYALSHFSAGRDIRFTAPRNVQGNLVNLTREIRVAGPGEVWVTSGRHVDLGASEGIYTIGNTNNGALAEDGASISVLSGVTHSPDYESFSKHYDVHSPQYSEVLTAYMQKRTRRNDLTYQEALTAYDALPENQRYTFLLTVLFEEIRASASKAARSGLASNYDPGFAAIETLFQTPQGGIALYDALSENQRHTLLLTLLFENARASAPIETPFPIPEAGTAARSGHVVGASSIGVVGASSLVAPNSIEKIIKTLFSKARKKAGTKGTPYQGDITLFFSKIHTVDGGDINLLAPGGNINAGLAVAFAGAKPASQLGIVAQRAGAINGLVDKNFSVNQSRVFAMDGGDISIWSSNGNIDAGRGAKSAIAAPPPIVTFDERGNLLVEFPPVVSGSGIRTAASTVPKPGDVYLAAPRGVVDAGEAGIGGFNVTIAATAVNGLGNIQIGGTSSGVLSNVAPPMAPASASAAAAAATQTAEKTATSSSSEERQEEKRKELAAAARLNPLTVDVLGFGECSIPDIRNEKPGCV